MNFKTKFFLTTNVLNIWRPESHSADGVWGIDTQKRKGPHPYFRAVTSNQIANLVTALKWSRQGVGRNRPGPARPAAHHLHSPRLSFSASRASEGQIAGERVDPSQGPPRLEGV